MWDELAHVWSPQLELGNPRSFWLVMLMSTSFGLTFLKQYVLRVNSFCLTNTMLKTRVQEQKWKIVGVGLCAMKDGKPYLKKKQTNYLLHFLLVYIARFILLKLNFVVSLFSGMVNWTLCDFLFLLQPCSDLASPFIAYCICRLFCTLKILMTSSNLKHFSQIKFHWHL